MLKINSPSPFLQLPTVEGPSRPFQGGRRIYGIFTPGKTIFFGALAVLAGAVGLNIANRHATIIALPKDVSNPDSGFTGKGINLLQGLDSSVAQGPSLKWWGSTISSMVIGAIIARIVYLSCARIPFPEQGPIRNVTAAAGSGKDLRELLNEVFYYSNEPRPLLDQLIHYPDPDNNLYQFLNKLSETIDYQKGGQWRSALAGKVAEYLKFVQENSSYRDRFFALIDGAGARCGDKVAFVLIFLGLEKKLMQADLDDLAGIYRLLLRGAWMVRLLEKIGHKKIEHLRKIINPECIDEIQIYLGYLIELKGDLQLLIDIDHMRFEHPLSPLDLQQATQEVLAAVRDPEKKYKFLAKHPVWQQALERKNPEAYAEAIEPILDGDPKLGLEKLIALTKTSLKGHEPDLFEEDLSSEPCSCSDCTSIGSETRDSVMSFLDQVNRLSQIYVQRIPSSSFAESVGSSLYLRVGTPALFGNSGWQQLTDPLFIPRPMAPPRYVNQSRSSSSVYSHFANE